MTTSSGTTVVNNVSYSAANQLLTIDYPTGNEIRAYNSLNQLTSLSSQLPYYNYAYTENLTYNYPSGTDNGKISSMYSAVSGETITYTYDSLNRLLTANGSGWGEQYGFDGFGNLLSKTVTAGSGPSLSVTVNPANNQISGYTYDANGNTSAVYNGGLTYDLFYDGENRLTSVIQSNDNTQVVSYAYDAQNRRFFSGPVSTDAYGNATNYNVYVFSPSGQRLGAYLLAPAFVQNSQTNEVVEPSMQVTLSTSDQYFGGRRLAAIDQLGSAGTYFPWGEDKGSTNPQNTWSYATYWRDSVSGLDYANNRYYSNAYGRFMTPDLSEAGQDPTGPQSWNKYAYVMGDPVNRLDASGLVSCSVDQDDSQCQDPGDDGDGSGGACDPSDASTSCDSCYGADGVTPSPSSSCSNFGPPILSGGVGFAPGLSSPGSQSTCKPGYVNVMGACLPYPGTVWLKLTLPGTNWCGPGGHGPTLNTLDAYCEQHDACYAEADVSPVNNLPRIGGRERQAAIHRCNVLLCRDVGAILAGPMPSSPPSQQQLIWSEATTIWDVFNCVSVSMKQ
jgi:RHS repeat-associated protein